jgi:hypothetical protein
MPIGVCLKCKQHDAFCVCDTAKIGDYGKKDKTLVKHTLNLVAILEEVGKKDDKEVLKEIVDYLKTTEYVKEKDR